MADMQIIELTPENIADYGVCGYKDVRKHKELRKKITWFNTYYPKGLRIKALVTETGGYQGMLEYIPGNLAHRPVNAQDYMFIHCLFVGFKKEFKGKGYASALIEMCIDDAKKQKMLGVSVVTRKGSFMANSEIFLKLGFEMADIAKPDFNLLVFKFDPASKNPTFKTENLSNIDNYKDGLTVFRSPQCPYTEKNVNAIIKTAEEKYNLKTKLIEITDFSQAQKTPNPFGTFCIIYKGEVISYHPISRGRFENIMGKRR